MANKHRHKTNKPITEFIPCPCGRCATETHEVYFGCAYLRNTSMLYEAQEYLCDTCHKRVHREYTFNLELKQKHQRRIMAEHEIDTKRFIEIFGKNYL